MSLTALQYSVTAEWLHKCGIHNFIIRPDGKVDVSGHASVWWNRTILEARFGTVHGTFDVSETQLASIAGFPEIINGDLLCYRTHIVSLSGIDKIVKQVRGNIKVNHNSTHLLGLLLIEGVVKLDTGSFRRDDILKKYIGTGDIISAQDELLDAGFDWSARL